VAQFVHTGNEVDLYLNGIKMDLVQTVTGNDDYGPEPASGIGDIHVFEYPPTVARHNITVSAMVLTKEKAIAAGVINENGDAAMEGLTFPIEIFKKTGPLIRKWLRAVNANGSIQVTAHRILVKNASFLACDAAGDYAG
jgi:hypothetical protein